MKKEEEKLLTKNEDEIVASHSQILNHLKIV